MPTYRYQMRRSAGGDVITGMLKAESMVLATQTVREMGGVPVDITRVGDEGVAKKGFLGLDLGAITSQPVCSAFQVGSTTGENGLQVAFLLSNVPASTQSMATH